MTGFLAGLGSGSGLTLAAYGRPSLAATVTATAAIMALAYRSGRNAR